MRSIFIYVFIFCIAYLSHAQQYNFRTYNVREGLGHSQVSQIIQDEKGYIWMTLFGGGISQFNGKDFINYGEKNGLCSNLTRPIIKDHTGKYWIGALGGKLCIYDGKISKPFSAPGDSVPDKIYSILEDDKFNIWLGTEQGIFIYDGKKVKHLNGANDPPQVPVMHVFQDSKKNIWIAPWESGVYFYNGKSFKAYSMQDGLSYHTAMGFSEDENGSVWINTFKGVSKFNYKAGEPSITKFSNPLLDSTLVFKAVDDGKSTLYFATSGTGVVCYNYKTQTTSRMSVKNGLPGNIIYNIFKDHESSLWLSCWGYGLTKFSGNRFIHYTTADGLLHNSAQCMVQDNHGKLWIGSGNGLNILHKGEITAPIREIANETVFSIVKDKQNGIWFSTSKAIYYYKDGKLKKYNEKDGIKAFPATAMAIDNTGNVWMGSWSGGVTKFDGKTFLNYTVNDGLSSLYIYSFYPDSKNNLWVCTWDGGLCKLSGNEFSYFKTSNGLPNNNVMAAREDKQGNLWVGTYGGGVAKFDGKKFHTISTGNGLSDDACNGILFDNQNNLWVATAKGLDKIDIDLFNKSGKINVRHYGAEEGFPALECLRNALYKTSDGKLWFGTKSGLSCYNAEEDFVNTKEPLTQITDIKLFFEPANFKPFCDSIHPATSLPVNLQLPYFNNHLTFNFVGISYAAPEKVRYRFWLEGADKDWSPVTNKTEATYSGLQPGKYVFKVIACNNDGVWNKEEVKFAFEILPPWYKTWWAYLSYLLVGAVIYFGTVQWRTKRLKQEKEKLEQVVKERTSEIVQQKNLVEEKNKEITDSIQYAKRIQSTLLAHAEFISEHISDNFVFFKPKDIVSGDFYWATYAKSSADNGNFYLAVCDSTGHGVPGAFMSLLNISFLNEAINEKKITEPGDVFNYVRSRLIENVSQDGGRDGMDGILICYNKNQNYFTYASAHNKPILIRDGKLAELSADKMPVGQGERQESFKTQKVELQKGDTLYLYTDGFADQFGGPKGKKFKYKQLNELLLSLHNFELSNQREELHREFNGWKGNLEQVDDVCVIGIRV
ncbi:MAG: SpoIIE family protein phosphatase [Bacteroidia bacterium]|nr:SpoIIE family protein phosphatase [Bacteroidia bacterium]